MGIKDLWKCCITELLCLTSEYYNIKGKVDVELTTRRPLVLDEFSEVEFVILNEGAVGYQRQDEGQDADAAQDHGPGFGAEAEAANLHLWHVDDDQPLAG